MRKLIASTLFFGAIAMGSAASAAECEVTITGNDAMKFDLSQIEISKSCSKFTVHLKHVGKLPRAAMGHNWVLTKEADFKAVAADGIAAGLNNQYVKPGDARVVAFTKVVGGGESDSVTFDVSKLNFAEKYEFFCSFPGHNSIMKGQVVFK